MAGELITQNTDHEGAVRRFIEQFKNKPDLEALTRIYLRQLQDVEDALFEIILERDLDNAVGVQLNTIGDIVQQPRTTPDDDRFRTAIRARIAINLSDATAEDLIKVANLLLQEYGESYELRDEPPAQVRLTIHDPLQSSDADLFHTLLDEADAGGVRFVLQWNNSLATANDKLLFGDTSGSTVTGGGLGSTTGSVTNPGKFSSVIGG
jgi:hypothetical protein